MLIDLFDDRPARLKTKVTATIALLVAANLAGWGWAWAAFADRPALLGTAFLAWLFGLRHAFDADHIAAIDNVVRKLMQAGRAPYSVGFFFSLGHSTIVVLASLAIAATSAALQSDLEAFHAIGGVIGTSVSAVFLLLIGIANLLILKGVWRAFQRVRRGEAIGEAELEAVIGAEGPLARIFRPLFKAVSHSWQMYPIGFLFGLGFDTATEIGVLGISATQAATGMSFWTILVFPALFTAGMSLLDTVDSMLMTRAYGWAFLSPLRKLWYNLTITATSVIVAVFIGGIEALGLLADRLELSGGIWGVVSELNGNLANFGYAVVAIFIASWTVSTWIYRWRGFGLVSSRGSSM
jgi:high-affinity nickel-transport protein